MSCPGSFIKFESLSKIIFFWSFSFQIFRFRCQNSYFETSRQQFRTRKQLYQLKNKSKFLHEFYLIFVPFLSCSLQPLACTKNKFVLKFLIYQNISATAWINQLCR